MFRNKTGLSYDEPLVVNPVRAARLLDIGHSRLYQLIEARELESYKAGKSRKITMASIERYIARQLAEGPRIAPVKHLEAYT